MLVAGVICTMCWTVDVVNYTVCVCLIADGIVTMPRQIAFDLKDPTRTVYVFVNVLECMVSLPQNVSCML